MKTLSFSNIKFADLQKVVNIRQSVNATIFQDWFGYSYQTNPEEIRLLEGLIAKHQIYVSSYSEDELKVKFLGPLLNAVEYQIGEIRDWYQRPLQATINHVTLSGYVDFMVAKGVKEPETPYFFIQEFKRTKVEIDPEDQLLAEMLVALALNATNITHGAYIIGRHWHFVILTRHPNDTYEYVVSKTFDGVWLDDLKQIYTNLQAVKYLFCNLRENGGID